MPITIDKPKCLVDLFGKSILQRQVDTFIESGITNIHVVAGYLSHKIKNFGFSISINSEYYKTNMVETLFSARSFIEQNGDLIISYGDIIFEQKNLDLLLNSNDEISLMIDKQWKDLWKIRIENPLEDAETLVIDGKEFITEIGKRPKNYNKIHGQYTGLIKVRSDKIGQLIDFYDTLDRNKLYDGKISKICT